MMWIFKTTLKFFFEGVEIGSAIYLMILLTGLQSSAPTSKNIASVMVMAGLVGLCSWLFTTDRISFLTAFIIHFFITFGLVTIMMTVNGWLIWNSLTFWTELIVLYLIIYAIAWTLVRIGGYTKLKRINAILKKRNQ
ncbi:DUF3021 domain-containing protein [Lentilactobacillus fungorum]|nr:DUF3021 domain-containing protein [Lentilactobacillus fungorum]